MTSDTFEQTGPDGRSVLRLERRYPHPIEKVWAAVSRPEHLAAWFPSKVEIELRTGGEIRFSGDPNLPDSIGRVTAVDPPRLLGFTWGDDDLRFELEPAGDGTRFRLVHVFADTYGAGSFASGWNVCLGALEDHLAGREPRELVPTPEDHDRYLRLFHLDDGTVEPVDGGRRVSFERQLTRPREDVEKAVADWPADVELREGTGHGPRLVLAVTVPTDEAAAAHAEWKARIDALESARNQAG